MLLRCSAGLCLTGVEYWEWAGCQSRRSDSLCVMVLDARQKVTYMLNKFASRNSRNKSLLNILFEDLNQIKE